MTQSQTLNVEYDELMARADELEAPFPTIPSTKPSAPCAISFVQDAATQISLSADSMRLYLQGCEREWKSLATSLRDAAKAYEEVDEEGADSIDAASDGEPGSVGGNDQMSAAGEGCFTPPPPLPEPEAFDYPYYEVRQAAMDMEAGDQGASFEACVQEWDAFQRALQAETYRFRPFTSWEGDARTLVEQNFESQRQWIYSMVQSATTLSGQAQKVVDAHKRARAAIGAAARDSEGTYLNPEEHPGPVDISNCDYWYKYYSENDRHNLFIPMTWYQSLQIKSERSLKLYAANASLPLSPVNPSMFPTGTPNLKLGSGSDLLDGIDFGNVGDGLPLDDGLPDPTGMAAGTGLPSIPEIPQMPDESMLTGAAPGVPSAGVGSGIKAASFGGGGFGDGAPAGPLKPPFFHDASPSPAPGANGAAGPGRGMPGAGGAMGGGMGGMAPMAPGAGKGQGTEKGERKQHDQESLYTEERPWTEGMIGLAVRRPKTVSEQEMPKPPEGFMYPIAR